MIHAKSDCQRRQYNTRLRRGAMLVMVAITMVILIVAAAFSVDIAYMYLTGEQLRVATDAAAKAAVVSLSQGSSQQSAIDNAVAYGAANELAGHPCKIDPSDVDLGKVAYNSGGTWGFSSGGSPMTAAQVTANATLPLFFAPVIGTKTFSPTKSSTAGFVRNKWCLVFDISGSMCFDMSGTDWSYPPPVGYRLNYYPPSVYKPHASKSRIANLIKGASTFLTTLTNSPGGTAQNRVGLVTFNNSANTNCTFSSTYTPITSALSAYGSTDIWKDGIANGGTNLASGIQAALDLFDATDDGTPWNKIIVVFSDGEWNEGDDPASLIPDLKSANITVHTIGLLSEGNNSTMQQLASQTGGQFYFATNLSQIKTAFQKIAESIPVVLTQ